jgi:tetratricopeptide (TPR) repeat protein
MKWLMCFMTLFLSTAQANETKQVMHQALDSMIHLMPFMSSELKFKDPKYEKEIALHLNKMTVAFKSSKHIKDFQAPGFSPNYEVINDHMEDTVQSFNSQNKTFARLRLASTTSLCLSCHTQLPKDRMTTFILDNKKVNKSIFENEYEYGNFLFLLRKYTQAISAYEKSIEQRKLKQKEYEKIQNILGSKNEQFDRVLYNTFRNALTIYAKVLKQPEAAINFFKKYTDDKEIPNYMKRDLQKWSKDLQKWVGKKEIDHLLVDDKEMQTFMQKYLAKMEMDGETVITAEMDVDLLVTSGVISNYLNANPKTKHAAAILYWLGISENRLMKDMFFSLGDLYLKECIMRYPKDPIAVKCFSEFENEINFRFTGSLGTNIPKSLQEELNRLKNLLR